MEPCAFVALRNCHCYAKSLVTNLTVFPHTHTHTHARARARDTQIRPQGPDATRPRPAACAGSRLLARVALCCQRNTPCHAALPAQRGTLSCAGAAHATSHVAWAAPHNIQRPPGRTVTQPKFMSWARRAQPSSLAQVPGNHFRLQPPDSSAQPASFAQARIAPGDCDPARRNWKNTESPQRVRQSTDCATRRSDFT